MTDTGRPARVRTLWTVFHLRPARFWKTTKALPRSFVAACAVPGVTPPVTLTVRGVELLERERGARS